jgi:exonuclease VII small subunit
MSDDQKYILLMEYYKRLRSGEVELEQSLRYLDAAQKMSGQGRVSKDAIEASRYL